MGIFKKKKQPAGSDLDRRILSEIYDGLTSKQPETAEEIARDILRRYEQKYSRPQPPPRPMRMIDLFAGKESRNS